MLSLYEISEKYLNIFDSMEFDENTGELLNLSELDTIDAEFDEKAENIACFIKSLKYESEALKNEENNLEMRRKKLEKKQDSLINYLTSCMDAIQKEKVNTSRCVLSFRKSKAVNILDEHEIPVEFIKVVEKKSPDKVGIKNAILSGTVVPGAEIVENRSLQIK